MQLACLGLGANLTTLDKQTSAPIIEGQGNKEGSGRLQQSACPALHATSALQWEERGSVNPMILLCGSGVGSL